MVAMNRYLFARKGGRQRTPLEDNSTGEEPPAVFAAIRIPDCPDYADYPDYPDHPDYPDYPAEGEQR